MAIFDQQTCGRSVPGPPKKFAAMKIRFSVVSPAPVGVCLAVCGSSKSLGEWKEQHAVRLKAHLAADSKLPRLLSEPDFHSADIEVPELGTEDIQYKFLELGTKDNIIKWEKEIHTLKHEDEDVMHKDGGPVVLLPVVRWESDASEKSITSLFFQGVKERGEISVRQVLSHLFVGSCPRSLEHIDFLHSLGITAVLNFQTEDDCTKNCIPEIGMDKNPLAVRDFYDSKGMQYIWMPTWDMDTQGRANMLIQASFLLAQILRNGHRVYLHCNAGVGRSTAAACGYLTFVLGLSARETQHVVASSRPVAVFNFEAIEVARPRYKALFEDGRCKEEALEYVRHGIRKSMS